MKLFFDTSVMIAAFVEVHPKHIICRDWFSKAKSDKNSLVISAHSIAECFSVLTKLPINPRISPTFARNIIEENLKDGTEIITMTIDDYFIIINQQAELEFSGGIIYDAILAYTAMKARVDKILTLNGKDFMRFDAELAKLVVSI